MPSIFRYLDLAQLVGPAPPGPQERRRIPLKSPQPRTLRERNRRREGRIMPGIVTITAVLVLPIAALSISVGLKEMVDTTLNDLERRAGPVMPRAGPPPSRRPGSIPSSVLSISRLPEAPVLALPVTDLETPAPVSGETVAELHRQDRVVAALVSPSLRIAARPIEVAPPQQPAPTPQQLTAPAPAPALTAPPAAPAYPPLGAPGVRARPEPDPPRRATPRGPPSAVASAGLSDPEINPEIALDAVFAAPFRVQIGAFTSESDALRGRRLAAILFGDILARQRLVLLPRPVEGAVLWRLIAGPFTEQAAAQDACAAIQRRSGACTVRSVGEGAYDRG
ncbi:MAG: SPOR domain-containing protein [Pseudomonadota bacterium]